MKFYLSLLAILFAGTNYILAQENEEIFSCEKARMHTFQSMAKGSILSPLEDDYDVKHVWLDLAVSNASTNLVGAVSTTFKVVNPNGMSQYAFELNPIFTIDSVVVQNQSVPFTTNGYLRIANLPQSQPLGTQVTTKVYYRGTPVASGRGINNISSPTWANEVTYTLSQPYAASYWWPCKQSLRDKIDSVDVWLTVPNTMMAGSQGLLKNISILPNAKKRFEWKSTYPIDYYLVSIAVSEYVDYSFYTQLPNSADSVLVQNFVYDNPSTLPFFKSRIDSTDLMIKLFSNQFGKYPFWKEKYGHCMAPINGGMEHQTMTSLGNFGTGLVAHELIHQWFGDFVTCGTWKDIWINEGWASYGEYLYKEAFESAASAAAKMQQVHNRAMDSVNGTVYVYDTVSESRIFNSALTYNKGSAVAHTLRYYINNDSVFFAAMRNFLGQYASSNATTADLQASLQQSTSLSYADFFDQWVYKAGYPIYEVSWAQGSLGFTGIRLKNTNASLLGVPFFKTPVDIRLIGPSLDTIVRLNQTQQVQDFTFFTRQITSVQVDPNNWIMDSVRSIVLDQSISVKELAAVAEVEIQPNPTQTYWTITGLDVSASLRLFDAKGSLIWTKDQSSTNTETIPAEKLVPGMYFLQVESNTTASRTFKLQKI